MNRRSHNFSYIKKLLSFFLSFALVLSMFPLAIVFARGVEENNAEYEAVNQGEAFEGEILLPGRQKSSEEIEKELQEGGVFELFDASDADYKNSIKVARGEQSLSADKSNSLPAKVDLRETGKVTTPKTQGKTGTCWAWGANAACETSLANATDSDAVELSPYQTAYFAYTPLSDDESELQGTEVSQKGEGVYPADASLNIFNIGGTSKKASSLMMQGCGPATAESIPFPQHLIEEGKYYDTDKLSSSQRRSRVANLTKWKNLGSLVTTYWSSGEATYETDEEVLLKIKTELSKGNAVEISYHGDSGNPETEKYFNYETSSQYVYEGSIVNHSVCIVGYDDDYSKENFVPGHLPEKDGAFIVKNSWGTDRYDDGFFYLSYYDKSICDVSTFEFDTATSQDASLDEIPEIIDQYDYTPIDNFLTFKLSSETWYSNIYSASQKQALHRIATFVSATTTDLSYRVYKLQPQATSPKGIVGSFDSPHFEGMIKADNEGFVSIELPSPLYLDEGEKYAIWFCQKGSDGSSYIPLSAFPYLDSRFSFDVFTNPQESFYSSDPTNTWIDKSGDGEWYRYYVTDNFCVKGYATSASNLSLVTFGTGGGSYVPTQALESGQRVSKPDTPTRNGYKFEGWFEAGSSTEFDFDTEITSDVTLQARWSAIEYKITYFGCEGATNDNPFGYTVEDEPITLNVASKIGYSFEGWSLAGDVITEISAGTTGDLELTANWSLDTYTIIFKGVDGATNPNGEALYYNINSEKGTLKDASKEGFIFDGWFNSSGNKVTEYGSGAVSDIVLTAHWTIRQYNVKFFNWDSTLLEEQEVEWEKAASLPENPTREGYTFAGWDKDFSKVTQDLEVYPMWEIILDPEPEPDPVDPEPDPEPEPVTYLVTFNSNGGSTVATQIIESGKCVTKPDNPIKLGYTFSGWYADSFMTLAFDFSNAITANVTLYAKWTKNGNADPEPVVESSTMHRLYNKWTGEHFYTSSDSEYKKLVSGGWNDEGEGWNAPTKSNKPVYRLYNPFVEGGDHHYTMDADERDNLMQAAWTYEGVGWYSDENKGVPLYRQYNPYATVGTHNYTTSKDEDDKLVKAGWRAEGISWYGVE